MRGGWRRRAEPVLVARNPERPAAVATETGAAAYSADVLDDPAFGELVERVEAEVGAIDGVVHAIGSVFLKPLHATSLADWRSTFEINATSAFFVMRKVMRLPCGASAAASCCFSTVAARALGGDQLRALQDPRRRRRAGTHADGTVQSAVAERRAAGRFSRDAPFRTHRRARRYGGRRHVFVKR